MAENMFGNLVKAVVDVRLNKIAVDAELHSDEESLLLESGSLQQDLWGINFYPEYEKTSANFLLYQHKRLDYFLCISTHLYKIPALRRICSMQNCNSAFDRETRYQPAMNVINGDGTGFP